MAATWMDKRCAHSNPKMILGQRLQDHEPQPRARKRDGVGVLARATRRTMWKTCPQRLVEERELARASRETKEGRPRNRSITPSETSPQPGSASVCRTLPRLRGTQNGRGEPVQRPSSPTVASPTQVSASAPTIAVVRSLLLRGCPGVVARANQGLPC